MKLSLPLHIKILAITIDLNSGLIWHEEPEHPVLGVFHYCTFFIYAMASQSAPSNVPLPDIDNEYWNERSQRRTAALHQLKAVLKEKLGREQVPPPFWAFCQVSDVSRLEEMVFIVEQAPNTKIAQLCLEPTIKDCDSAIA